MVWVGMSQISRSRSQLPPDRSLAALSARLSLAQTRRFARLWRSWIANSSAARVRVASEIESHPDLIMQVSSSGFEQSGTRHRSHNLHIIGSPAGGFVGKEANTGAFPTLVSKRCSSWWSRRISSGPLS